MALDGTTSTYDLDLHGVVRVRLLDAKAGDLATVTRQLGPLRAPVADEPDITVRFVDVVDSGRLTYVEVGRTGFDAEGFFALQARHCVAARTRLPLDAVGRGPIIVCERAVTAVPHLLAIVNLTALAKGVLPLHASAFVVDGRGVLVTGWSKGGKTESLLAGMGAGARYVADEWVYLTSDRQMFGVPEPIRLWGWHFDQLPDLLRARDRRDRWRLRRWQTAHRLAREVATRRNLPGSDIARRGAPILARQAYLQVPPQALFGADRIQATAGLDAVVLLLSHEPTAITASPAGPTEISARMAASLEEEREPFMADYRRFRYAFPDRSSALVESAHERERELLRTLFDGRSATRVAHPYPCDLRALGEAVRSAAQSTCAQDDREPGLLGDG